MLRNAEEDLSLSVWGQFIESAVILTYGLDRVSDGLSFELKQVKEDTYSKGCRVPSTTFNCVVEIALGSYQSNARESGVCCYFVERVRNGDVKLNNSVYARVVVVRAWFHNVLVNSP